MLTNLSIRDVVVIKELDVEFGSGLTALTGETGSGKSILLDALGLALGMRADASLVRQGAERASVTAQFDLPKKSPVHAILQDQGLESGDQLILRRILGADGKSRAFANDQPIGVQLLKQIGIELIEIHGQFDQHGLLDAATHRATLDDFAALHPKLQKLNAQYQAWKGAEKSWAQAVADQQTKQTQEQYLRHAINELRGFEPKSGEEEELSARRTLLQHREKIVGAIGQAMDAICGDKGADRLVLTAQKSIGRIADKAPDIMEPILQSLERASIELQDAGAALQNAVGGDGDAQAQLETLEDRLFSLRELSRKYDVPCDALAELLQKMESEIDFIDNADAHIAALFDAAQKAKKSYGELAADISAARKKAAQKLDKSVAAELEPLKLGRAIFTTQQSALPDTEWAAHGIDKIEFAVITNPGMPAGPLHKIASGGELSRFMLAIKVVLAGSQNTPTMIFDEIDTGVSGGVADAVGSRLERLGENTQVLLVTHSPQVAAKAQHHYRISKKTDKNSTQTVLERLNAKTRREELAKMLSGASITDEARAAAGKLLGAA